MSVCLKGLEKVSEIVPWYNSLFLSEIPSLPSLI